MLGNGDNGAEIPGVERADICVGICEDRSRRGGGTEDVFAGQDDFDVLISGLT